MVMISPWKRVAMSYATAKKNFVTVWLHFCAYRAENAEDRGTQPRCLTVCSRSRLFRNFAHVFLDGLYTGMYLAQNSVFLARILDLLRLQR